MTLCILWFSSSYSSISANSENRATYFAPVFLEFKELAFPSTPATTPFILTSLPSRVRSTILKQVTSTIPIRGGSCWKALFSESVPGHRKWVSVKEIKNMAANFRLDLSRCYSIVYCQVGLVHLQVRDDGIWTAYDILLLPDWVLIGGTFLDDGLDEGYPKELLEHYCYFHSDAHRDDGVNRSDSSSGSSRVPSTPSSTGKAQANSSGRSAEKESLIKILEHNWTATSAWNAVRLDFLSRGDDINLTRFDMELISRATNGYCYSACVSSAAQFRRDVLLGPQNGDTLDSYLRFRDNEVDKRNLFVRKLSNKESPNTIPKTLHIDLEHISRYKFDGSTSINTEDIQKIIALLFKLQEQVHARENTDGVVQDIIDFSGKKASYMALTYDIVGRLEIDLRIFKNQVYRILDIRKGNTFEQAQEAGP